MKAAFLRRKILNNPQQTEAVVLAAHGFAYKYIAKVTGLSEYSVKYWCKQFNVKVTDFRTGKSQFAKTVRNNTKQFTEEFLINEINHSKLSNNGKTKLMKRASIK